MSAKRDGEAGGRRHRNCVCALGHKVAPLALGEMCSVFPMTQGKCLWSLWEKQLGLGKTWCVQRSV